MRTFAQATRTRAASATRAVAPVRAPARNPAVRTILNAPLQPKLRIGAINDPAEAEADRIADEVMRMPDPAAASAPPEPSAPGEAGTVRRSEGILGIPGTGGTCCHDSPEDDEWALVGDPSEWRQLSKGDCTGFSEDCDGMTCGGGFYKVSDLMRGTCRTPNEDDWFFSSRRWTPNSPGENAQSPTDRGGPSNTPPGYVYRTAAGPDTILRMQEDEEETVQRKCAACEAEDQGLDTIRRKCAACEAEETLRPKESPAAPPAMTPGAETAIRSLGPGQPLPAAERAFFEPRLGRDLSAVRLHTGDTAHQASHAINARAFAIGRDIAFAAGEYAPGTTAGRRLMAHELAHVGQQAGQPVGPATRAAGAPGTVRRTLGDGHDLTSPRFSRILDLEEAYDDEKVIRSGQNGRGVQAIQQALYDLGFALPKYGADGDFGSETKAAVEAFQNANPPLVDDGEVGELTMAKLDARFGMPALPSAAKLAAAWTAACVRAVICPWSPHTIDVLRTRITLKSFDSISWADEEWDGAAWIAAPFPGGGYNTGTEIGVLNSSCESMSETLYHEVLHAEQPSSHRTTRARESYAYRIGEEFSIALGLRGRPGLRSTDAQGREFADRAKVDAFVAASYPSVPSGGYGDEIIGKAAAHGHVRVQRPDGSIYTRPAAVGEKVPGPISLVNEVTHSTAGWTCP